MANGSYDSRGIYMFGESDDASPLSDLLNVGMDSVSDAFALDRSRLSSIETQQNAERTAWTSYTPTLGGSTTNPSGVTASGRYMKIGRIVVCWFYVGTGASAGSGTYTIGLPVTAVTTAATIGTARLFDNSSGNAYVGARVGLANTGQASIQYTATWGGTLQNVSATTPWTWAAGDLIDGTIIYEAAS